MTTQPPSLLQCLGIQRRVLHALLMREIITRFGRENLGVLWLVAEPMLFTLGVATLWTAAGLHHGSPIPIVAFAVTGYSSVLMWRNSATVPARHRAEQATIFHRNVQSHRRALDANRPRDRRCDGFVHRVCPCSSFSLVGCHARTIYLRSCLAGSCWPGSARASHS